MACNIVPTIMKAVNIITNPMTVDLISDLALVQRLGSAPAKSSIPPPITSINVAMIITVPMAKLRTLLISLKISQNPQGDSPSPPQGTKPAACVWLAAKNKNTKTAKTIFFILFFDYTLSKKKEKPAPRLKIDFRLPYFS
ncbi:MAG: hypothetical protein ABIB55_01725 [Candidatus Nealsonbacteria bacterium]